MSARHESETDHLKRLSITKSTEGVILCNVQGRLKTWKKENTCKRCDITYENFQTLLDHSCLPHRCTTCSMAFLYDYMLKMHKCGVVQSHAKNSHQTHYCKICGSTFFELNLLLQHQSHCTNAKKCIKCEETLTVKNKSKFCQKCNLTDNDQKYFLRCKQLNKLVSSPIISEVCSSKIEISVETDTVTTDQSNSTFNDISSCAGLEIASCRRKRKSVDDTPENSSKKIHSKDLVKDIKNKSTERCVITDRLDSLSYIATCKNSDISNWKTRTSKKSNAKELEKGVKNKSALSVDSLENRFKTKRKFDKRKKDNLFLNEGYINNTNTVKLSVHEGRLANEDIDLIRKESDLKKSVVSVLSQTGKRNETEKKKPKFSSTSYNSHKIKESTVDKFEKPSNVLSSIDSKHLKKNGNVKAKKEISSKKNNLEPGPVKSPSLVKNLPNGVKKINIETVKKNTSVSLTNSKKEFHPSGEKSYITTIESYTPELEIASSTLNTVPDIVSSARVHFKVPPTQFKSSPSHSKDRELEKNKGTKKRSNVLNTENNTIRLESLLHVLPDEESGILLKVFTNFRCPKCNKLFKKVKMAAIHYTNCKSSRMKKKMLVSLTDIEWLCLQCHFHCTQISELNSHRRSCPNSSFNVSIENCIKSYSDSCLNYCPKCSYSCISFIMFNQHPCEKRLEYMKKCYIGVKRLTDVDPTDETKYRCNFCESVFFNYTAYKKHVNKHKPNEILKNPSFGLYVSNEKSYAKQEIKNILKKNQNLETPDDIIKKWLEPISNVCSSMDSENLFPNLNLNLVISKEHETLIRGAAEKILTIKEENMDNLDNNADREFASQCVPSDSYNASTSTSNPVTSTNAFHRYMKDYNCEHDTNYNSKEENKPCLNCLNDYIEEKGLFLPPEETLTSTNDTVHSNLPQTGSVPNDIITPNIVDASVSYDSSNCVPPIHISSVESCSYEMASINLTFTNSESNNHVPDTAGPPCSEKLANEKHLKKETPKNLLVTFVLVAKVQVADSKYTVEAHNDLIRSIFDLKRIYMPNDSASLKEIKDDKYYQETNNFPQTLLISGSMEGNSVNSEDNLNRSSFSPTHNLNHPSNAHRLHSNSSILIHNSQLTSPNEVHFILKNISNQSPTSQSCNMDQYVESSAMPSISDVQNSDAAFKNVNGCSTNAKTDHFLLHCIEMQCPFEELMKILVTQKPCDFDLIAVCSHIELVMHVSWQTFPKITFSAYTEPYSEHSEVSLICALCFDRVASSLYVQHIKDIHEEHSILNILIS